MYNLQTIVILLSLEFIFLQHHDAMKCGYVKNIAIIKSSDRIHGQTLGKHIKINDDMTMIHCHCFEQSKVIYTSEFVFTLINI